MPSKTLFVDARTEAQLLENAAAQIRSFVSSDLFALAANSAFGASGGALAAAIRDFDRKGWPKLVLLDEHDLHGARAAYSQETDTIYLSRTFVASASSSAVTAVIVEEIGHALDARLNRTDSAGDEGQIFSTYVMGHAPTASELAAMKGEDDHSTIVVDGRTISVELAAPVVGSVTLDGSLADWTVNDQIDKSLSVSGYDLYAKSTGGSYVFAIKAPVAVGANTTVWLNTDQNAATGYKIWGWAGGAEYNINFDSTGTPRLYTGADGQTLVSGATVSYGFSADRTVVEFAVAASTIGAPSALNTLWDINNATFLPTDFSSAQYSVSAATTPAPAPVVGSVTVDGNLADWTATDVIDKTLSTAGYDLYAKATGGSFAFAIKAPVAIGANTTVWLNTDQNTATGYKIWGWAGGAEYNINFDATGTPRLYTGADGQTLVNVPVTFAYSADRTAVEFTVVASALGGPAAINTLWDINNATYLPGDYSATQYTVGTAAAPAPVIGAVTLDGALTDWSAANRLDTTGGTTGYALYGKETGGSFVFALSAPVAIGANTTAWLNTDQNSATGFKIFGTSGGAEYNINFDASGTPRLYTGDAGQTLVPNANITFGYSADHKVVEFAVQASALGNPVAVNTLWDVNNSVFLPGSFAGTQYTVVNTDALPARTDFSKKIGILYSDTTAAKYFSTMAYSQLFMDAQSQAAMAGVHYDILTEADLTNLAKLANYDALLFPSFQNVKASQVSAIENTLKILVEQYKVGLIASGNFMTNDENGAALPGDSYARMKTLLDLQPVGGGFPANFTVNAGDIAHPMMQDYTAGETIHSYTGTGWQAFAPVTAPGTDVLATQNVGGVTYNSVITTTTGGRNVHFSSDAVMGDNNLLWQAIDYAVNGSGVTAGLQLSRNASIVAARNDMDQAMELFDVKPENGGPGIYDKLVPILQQWKTQYNFVGSYYVDIGNSAALDQGTNWAVSGQYYKQMLAMGNEIGSHSYTHPEDTNLLTAAQFQFEFQQSRTVIEQQMSAILGRPFTLDGAAVPGAPENLATALSIIQYYDYLSGGFSSIGAGYPNALGYLTPAMAAADKVYLAPNVKFDFSLVEFGGMTPAQASAEWAREVAELSKHGDVPILLWPMHDYAEAMWSTNPPAGSPYTTQMFTDFIARAYQAGSEFVTLSDLADRISRFNDSYVSFNTSGSTVTATVVSPDAGKFALDLDNLGTQKIASVANWYAYDDDSVFLDRDGGTFTITLGAAATDVTHITALPMRGELLSVTGNGTNLNFSVIGEGSVVVDLHTPTGQQAVVTGGTVKSLVGDLLTIDVGAYGQHDVGITFAAVNHAPAISSNGGGASAALSIAENATAVTTVKATDVDAGQTLTYLISGGADAAKFGINATTGALAFLSAPDFENPTDSGANRVYDVIVSARDNLGALDTQALAVTVTNIAGLTLNGTNSANTLNGAGEEDTISGLNGNDTLNGLGGNDTIIGGAGNDTMNGGDGNDVLIGGAGSDKLTGGAGRDRFDYNAINEGTDTITDFARGATGDVLDIHDVLVGYRPGISNVNAFVRLSGGASTTVSVNADGAGTDFVALATLQNVAMSSSLLNDLVAQGNLAL
ncbi:MAG TPA: type I secretion C-terminal target domain-containing protein [Burkholderiales bacterium]|nr:type I secretion C-terminal target domain-containing protein [Burkholderiales bacterium]